jgi:uncharacterized protein (TIGR03435 family)
MPIESYLREALALAGDHLWQSTLFSALAAAATLGFRKNRARVRFGLWLAASIKFLVPFAVLVWLGAHLAPMRESSGAQTSVYAVIEQVGQPFSKAVVAAERASSHSMRLPELLALIWLPGTVAVFGLWWLRWRRVAAMVGHADLQPAAGESPGRELAALRESEQRNGVARPLRLLVSEDLMEPGVCGILRPTLIWPAGISQHLADAHLRAILAHELWHVRRRDNLAAALHMVVEAIFWFHPLVWWIGSQLVKERENACDEAVLDSGSQPEVYAESILLACRFCVEAPLTCVSGVAGSNLKRRINRIMNGSSQQNLSFARRTLLLAAAVTVIAGPVIFGVIHAPGVRAQAIPGNHMLSAAANASAASFDTVSIKPSLPGVNKVNIQIGDHTFSSNTTVKELIKFAYGVESYQVQNAPTWTGSERYEIVATWKDSPATAARAMAMPGPPPPPGAGVAKMNLLAPMQLQAMVQNLLAQKFNLKSSSQTEDMPVFELVVASSGAKLTPMPKSPAPPSFNGEQIISVKTRMDVGNGELNLNNGPVAALAGFLSGQVDQQVIDKTGIQGNYDIALRWTQDENAAASISRSLEEQLGLELRPQHAPVKVIVVDQIDKPVVD